MSASNSPPNPGAPKAPLNKPSTPAPTNLARYGPRILLAGVALGVTYALIATRPPKPAGTPAAPNPMRTPGVQNIEGAYQSGGATSTHTMAYGGTKQGEKENIERVDGKSGTGQPKGVSGGKFGDEQRPGATSPGGEFKEMQYGDKRGK